MRLHFIDWIKSIAILLVLMYHSGVIDNYDLFYPIISMCVPLFFIASGYVREGKEYSNKDILITISKGLMLIVFWGSVSTMTKCLLNGENFTITSLINKALHLRIYYCNYLWYLGTFIILSVIHHIICDVKTDRLTLFAVLSFVCSFQIVDKFVLPFNPFSGWHSYALTYYLIGILIKRLCEEKKVNYIYPVFIFTTSYILQIMYNVLIDKEPFMIRLTGTVNDTIFNGYKTIPVFFMVISLFFLAKEFCNTKNIIVEYLSRNVFGIYLIHIFFIYIANYYCLNSIIKFALSLGLSIIAVKMMGNKYMKMLIRL